eukprot:scaffold90626_cov14-Tisochrysis_lutea.AAC.1
MLCQLLSDVSGEGAAWCRLKGDRHALHAPPHVLAQLQVWPPVFLRPIIPLLLAPAGAIVAGGAATAAAAAAGANLCITPPATTVSRHHKLRHLL